VLTATERRRRRWLISSNRSADQVRARSAAASARRRLREYLALRQEVAAEIRAVLLRRHRGDWTDVRQGAFDELRDLDQAIAELGAATMEVP
jgi:hypothetical protein